ncbi:MAG: dihydroorotate dehydrogenase electron transfer subunit [Eubacteriales bacterium]|nr:dihydroorotate dehydrogenase electron transfer subunit [Eubacteriales bacterium]
MPEKWKETARIIQRECIGDEIYSMWLETEEIARNAVPGQFISVYCRDGSRLLPRPISICEIDERDRTLRLVYRAVGKGTEEFAELSEGEYLEILGPLGNGFPLDRCGEGKKAFLIGGGIGIPPLVELAKQLKGEKQIILGYRDERFLDDELEYEGSVYVATEDGSYGTKGNVLDAIRENGLTADVIYACGPTPMLRALKSYAEAEGIECWLSLEERMACGVGACLGCVCKSTEIDPHSQVHNKRICKDGPVFRSTEVEL